MNIIIKDNMPSYDLDSARGQYDWLAQYLLVHGATGTEFSALEKLYHIPELENAALKDALAVANKRTERYLAWCRKTRAQNMDYFRTIRGLQKRVAELEELARLGMDSECKLDRECKRVAELEKLAGEMLGRFGKCSGISGYHSFYVRAEDFEGWLKIAGVKPVAEKEGK